EPGVGGHVPEELLERLQAAGGRADGDDRTGMRVDRTSRGFLWLRCLLLLDFTLIHQAPPFVLQHLVGDLKGHTKSKDRANYERMGEKEGRSGAGGGTRTRMVI